MYSTAFLDHVAHPRGQGTLPDATHRGEAEDAACGDRLSLDLRVEAGVVKDARFRVVGCPGSIAVGSALAVLLPGRRAAGDPVSSAEIEGCLGGIPPAKRHALRLASETVKAALRGELPPASHAG